MPGANRWWLKFDQETRRPCSARGCGRTDTVPCGYRLGTRGLHFICPDHRCQGIDMYGREFCSDEHLLKAAREDPV